jgi:ABC-2 type transport system ATP-binding protein
MEAVLTVQHLRKTFTSRQKPVEGRGPLRAVADFFSPPLRTINAVDDVSFSVDRGELLAFIGPNGAGKSTTIKCLTGILYPTSGALSVLGMDPHRQRRKLAYRIGTVFGQRSQLWFHLPPLDSLRLLGDIYAIDRREAQRRIDFLTEVFEIGPYLRTPVRKLSLGERIRCEIAGALLHEPEILFLDEPTIGLDVVARQIVRDLIRRINEEKKTTIFLTSHDAGDIEKICRRVIVINHGRIAWDDTVKSMKYSFLRRKVIDLKLDAPLELSREGVTVLKSKGYAAKLEVDLERVGLDEVVADLMRANKVEDITISNPPLEQIIAMIYGTKKEEA